MKTEAIASHDPAPGARTPLILRVNDLVCGYTSGIVGPLSFTLPEGAFMLIEGPNGVGKSTMIKTLIGLIPPLRGELNWNVERRHLRFVPQTRTLDPMLPATVHDVISTGLHRGTGWQALRGRDDRGEVEAALETVAMTEYDGHLFRELSEGQKQLVLLARALLGEPRVLLLDEPSASMDIDREAQSVEILKRLQVDSGVTIMMIAHGSEHARQASDHLLSICRTHGISLTSRGPGEHWPIHALH